MEKRISILFDSYHLYHLPQFEPLIDLLSNDKRFNIYHSVSRDIKNIEYELCAKILKQKPGSFIFADNEEKRKKIIKNLNLDVFICGWSRYSLKDFVNDKTLVGMIYHGIGVKPSYWLDNNDRLDLRFVEGEYRMNQLRNNGVKTDLTLTGYIKLDPLFKDDGIRINPDIEKLALNLNPDKKTILFAPTFYPSSAEKIGLNLGEYTKGYNLLIKPHLWTIFLNKFGQVDLRPQRELFYALKEKYKHIHLIEPDQYNITPYYKISDLLLTEASSTIYEMLALGKPVVINRFFKLKLSHRIFKYRLYRKRLNKEMSSDISKFCFEVDRPASIPKIIEEAFAKNENCKHEIREFQDKMLYKLDGKASERARDAILSKLHKSNRC